MDEKSSQIGAGFEAVQKGISGAIDDKSMEYARRIIGGEDIETMGIPGVMREKVDSAAAMLRAENIFQTVFRDTLASFRDKVDSVGTPTLLKQALGESARNAHEAGVRPEKIVEWMIDGLTE